MKRTTGLMATLIVGALVAFGAGLIAQSKADVALRAAIETETVKGDLKAAIAQYKALAAGPDRAVAAKALVRLGECYQKQGNAESTKAWERVVRDYADQKEAAAEAQRHLAADVSRSQTGIVATRAFATIDFRIYGQSVSADGRYIAFTMPWGYGLGPAIVVHDLVNGEERTIAIAASYAETAAAVNRNVNGNAMISPDGRQVAYISRTAADGQRLHVVNADGSGPRVLVSQRTGLLRLCGWAPDGAWILVTISPDLPLKAQLRAISVADGSSVAIGSPGVLGARYSPDGRYLAVEKASSPPFTKGIYVTTATGDREVLVVEDNNASSPVWSEDGRRLLLSRWAQQGTDLWSVEVANGRPAGLPELVKKDVPPLLAGTRDGSYYYVARSETFEMYLVDVDPKTGARVSRPKSVAGVGYGTNAVWSPDGGSLAYRSAQTEAHAIVIRSAETGTERLLSLKGLPDAWGFDYIAWFSDGRSLLLQGRGRVYRADLQTGESRQVLASARMRPWGTGSHGRLRLTPDGLAAYFTDVDDARHTSILRQNLEGGPAVVVCKVEDTIMGPSLSPDGSTLAFATVTGYGTDREHWAVMTVPGSGGEPKEIFGTRTVMVDPVWSRDGRWLYFAADASPEHQGLRQDIWRVPVSGGKPEPLDMGLHRMANFDFSPDGKHLVFRDYQNKNELWVMKNLFPAPKTGK